MKWVLLCMIILTLVLPECSSSSINGGNDASQNDIGEWSIVDIDARVTEQNDTWWRYSWILTLKNDTPNPILFDATIEFLDTDGFIIDDDREYNMIIPANTQKTFTGYVFIDSSVAPNVSKVSAKVQEN